MSSGQEKTCDCGACVAERGCTWAEYVARLNPAPSPQPEMPEYVELDCPHCETLLCVDLDELRASLATHGLHVIGAKQKAVLDACEALDLRQRPDGLVTCYGGHRKVELAELARRAAKDSNV